MPKTAAFCGDEAYCVCDGCDKPMCCACNAELDDPVCPNEFCLECVIPRDESEATDEP